MNYEVKFTWHTEAKEHKEEFLIACDTFSEAESLVYAYVEKQGGLLDSVKAIKVSNVTEVVEEPLIRRELEEDDNTEEVAKMWYKVTIEQDYTDPETGRVKPIKYRILLQAEDPIMATNVATEHMEQVMDDYVIRKIEETKISGVFL